MARIEGPILVTGGRRGLGAAMAEALAQAGAAVYASSRNGPAELKVARPGEIVPVRLDVRDGAQVKALFDDFDRAGVALTALINNAGVGYFRPFSELSIAELDEMLQTNLRGAFLCAQAAFQRFRSQGGGRIVNIGSICDHTALPENSGYAASKYGLRGLSEVIAQEGKAHGIRVSLVSPGAVWSDIWQGREGFHKEDMLAPADVAETIVDLLSRPQRVWLAQVTILPPKGIL